MLLLAAVGIDALGVRRGLKAEYFIFTDPLDHSRGRDPSGFPERPAFSQMGLSVAAVLFVLQIVVGQAEPVKYAFMRRGPESICQWRPHYAPLLPLPWCPSEARP